MALGVVGSILGGRYECGAKCSWSHRIGSLKTEGGLSHAKEGEEKQLPGRQKAQRKL